MIEKTVYNYLKDMLSVPAYMETPEDMPKAYVLLEKTASGQRGRLWTAVIAVQSYGGSLLDAASLNEQVKTAMQGLAALDEICRVSLNSDYNFTDTQTKRYRYQAVFDITHY